MKRMTVSLSLVALLGLASLSMGVTLKSKMFAVKLSEEEAIALVGGALSGDCHKCVETWSICDTSLTCHQQGTIGGAAVCVTKTQYDNNLSYTWWECDETSGYTDCSTSNFGLCCIRYYCEWNAVWTKCVKYNPGDIWSRRTCDDQEEGTHTQHGD